MGGTSHIKNGLQEVKAKTAGAKRTKKKKPAALDQLQPGMPALDSITGVEEVKRGKRVFQIIHTSEVDQYELPVPAAPPKKRRRKPQTHKR